MELSDQINWFAVFAFSAFGFLFLYENELIVGLISFGVAVMWIYLFLNEKKSNIIEEKKSCFECQFLGVGTLKCKIWGVQLSEMDHPDNAKLEYDMCQHKVKEFLKFLEIDKIIKEGK